jgi:two-component system LytT family sensor kinase
MRRLIEKIAGNRFLRHMAFWICWIVSFTFIKSFGKSYEFYLGWFSYYIVTLPIFVSHTYLVAYVLIPRFFTKKRLPLFVLFFAGLLYSFSVLELLLSNEFIFKWYPTGTIIPDHYLNPVNVVISGLGNMYILLVFLAARTIRNWSIASRKQNDLEKNELQQQMEETMTRVQPLMLLYAIDHIDKMVEAGSSQTTKAIAHTSALLSEVMFYHEENHRWISREIELVRKLLDLVSVFKGHAPEVEFFISGDPESIDLPPMILFSIVDLLIRRLDPLDQFPEMNIEASGFSNMISIQVLKNASGWPEKYLEDCVEAIRKLDRMYGNGADISLIRLPYGCSVLIRKSAEAGVSVIASTEEGVGTR